jgi:hypothetical protein
LSWSSSSNSRTTEEVCSKFEQAVKVTQGHSFGKEKSEPLPLSDAPK